MKLAHDQHVDWPAVLMQLQGHGWTLVRIGAAIGTPEDRVRKWLQIFAQPRHDDGERLVALWCAVMRAERDAVPVVSRFA